MKSIVCIVLISFSISVAGAQNPVINTDSIPYYFNQVKQATRENIKIWDKDIYGPIMFVNPDTRVVYCNEPDKDSALVAKDGYYTGTLPKEISFQNTSLDWNGKTWATVVLPLPANKYQRIDLITHELFHSAQLSLGYDIGGSDNYHLDDKDGRIYLRLEIEALIKALKAKRLSLAEEHLRNALIFRRYRHLIYSGSQLSENKLELLEGLATYTGQMMSGRDKWQLREYLIDRLENYDKTPTFVRSFAYETVPVYGFFLYQKDNNWNKGITGETDLTEFFEEAFELDMRIILPSYVGQVAEDYHGRKIRDEETIRSEKNAITVNGLRDKFLEKPHLEIKLENMNMSFNPVNLIPLDVDEGTVYPTIRISDNWGILTVTSGGALLSPGQVWVVVSEPLEIKEDEVIGNGWRIELNKGYYLEKNNQGNYLMTKKK
ncbi:MAG: hypothetical protein VB098_05420 [Petrimonas sp.]|nr:hypothetical protein [Petrimonas sp.]MEA4979317.1 hypothetical protein [Petrimonas sp.]MEA5063691.1 hypothetical protein [Petrimonas sp.]